MLGNTLIQRENWFGEGSGQLCSSSSVSLICNFNLAYEHPAVASTFPWEVLDWQHVARWLVDKGAFVC